MPVNRFLCIPRVRLMQRMAPLGLLFCSALAGAQEVSFSTFGTAGYAVSNRDYKYQRFISNDGTFKRDSVLGGQVDAQFSPEWSATLQAKVAPSLHSDRHWDLTASWAFLSWRPNNDWLIRPGRVRIPLYLYSQNLDVGQSYDFVRMPTEMYSISPTTDIAGLYVTRNWSLGGGDLSVDVYGGRSPVNVRFYTRAAGTDFKKVDTNVVGTVATWRSEDVLWRAGIHHAATSLGGYAAPTSIAPASFAGLDFYAVTGTTPRIANDILTFGLDLKLDHGWRFLTEIERNFQHKTDFGANTVGGYVSVLRSMDRWTPYVVLSALRTVGAAAHDWQLLNQVTAPGWSVLDGALADGIPYYDQHSLAAGTSFALNLHSKLKLELMHTWIGKGSVMIDSPPGGPPTARQGINVLSLSYNFAY